jgi:pimeloyl-ACP methyl ester carboxylesterase
MKMSLKIVGRIVMWIVILITLLFVTIAGYHHLMLLKEAKGIQAVGMLVEVDGYKMNILLDGIDTKKGSPTIVLLSGSGVAAPVYDYKILYSKLTDSYQVAVIEKFGYGYSDICGLPRDVQTMVEEDRKALKIKGQNGPYVLMPHSMSALEALYWASTYPNEVKAIIGLDMAVPGSYNEESAQQFKLSFNRIMTSLLGLQRIPSISDIHKNGLSEQEVEQLKWLVYRNTLNNDVYAECQLVYENARRVGKLRNPNIPILMFTTNLGDPVTGKYWMAAQDDFAKQSINCTQIKLNCGHNLHYYKSDYIAQKIKMFMNSLKQ